MLGRRKEWLISYEWRNYPLIDGINSQTSLFLMPEAGNIPNTSLVKSVTLASMRSSVFGSRLMAISLLEGDIQSFTNLIQLFETATQTPEGL